MIPACVLEVAPVLRDWTVVGGPVYWTSPREVASAAGMSIPRAYAALHWLGMREVVVPCIGVREEDRGQRRGGMAWTIPADVGERLDRLLTPLDPDEVQRRAEAQVDEWAWMLGEGA